MKKYLITTVSTLALMLGAAGVVAAPPTAQSPPSVTPTAPDSPGAGAIIRQGDMEHDPAMQQRHSIEPRADSSTYRAFSATRQSIAGATITGGMTANDILGADVIGPSGEKIGQVQDLAIGSDSKISKAIIEVGSFLGVGSRYVAVDVTELKQGAMEGSVVTAITKRQFEAAPEFEKEGNKWVRAKNAGASGNNTSGGAMQGGITSPGR